MDKTQKAYDELNAKIDSYCDSLKTNKLFQAYKNRK